MCGIALLCVRFEYNLIMTTAHIFLLINPVCAWPYRFFRFEVQERNNFSISKFQEIISNKENKRRQKTAKKKEKKNSVRQY